MAARSWIGVVAEFDSPERLLGAISRLRDRGYRRLDAYTPYPIMGLERALGHERSWLGWLVFPVGLFGAAFAFLLQAYVNAIDYPLNAGGRPPFAWPAFIIITFETMVLFSGVTAFVLLFWLSRLPHLAHPLFRVGGFERVTDDRFWLGVSVRDERFDPDRTEADLRDTDALRIEFVGGGS